MAHLSKLLGLPQDHGLQMADGSAISDGMLLSPSCSRPGSSLSDGMLNKMQQSEKNVLDERELADLGQVPSSIHPSIHPYTLYIH